MTLGRAKILSSENDASVSQNTNINIRIAKSTGNLPQQQPVNFTQTPIFPETSGTTFQQVETREGLSVPGCRKQSLSQQSCQNSLVKPQLQSPSPPIQQRGLADLTNELDTLEERNRMLELLLSVYEDNPLRINNYLVCKSKTLMELIKNLTYADKVELLVDEDSGCTGCISNAKYMNIEKILIIKGSNSTEFKHGFNDIYTELIRHGISLKLCV